ncbi:MAG: tetratricopeptide repeat protein [Jatrophihabitantaceae bacterium]
MTGAVDLAAVRARAEAAARAAQAPAPDAGHFVVDVTEESFQTEVLDRSFQRPVLVDLRAARSAASEQLSPLLERLALEANGSWILARIDIDADPRLAQALQVQSVPTVFAVLGGQLVPGFQGALPEDQLREFVAAVLLAAQEAGLAADGVAPTPDAQPLEELAEEPEDPRFVAAEDALQAGDYALSAQRYQAILDAEPANSEAAVALRQVRLFERLESHDPALAARADAAPHDIAAQLAAADLSFANNDVDGALRRLLSLLARTGSDERDVVRERLIEYFELLGGDDPRVAPARRELARVLF